MTVPEGHYEDLEEHFERLLPTLPGQGWSDAEIAEVRHFLDHGEYGLALETLTSILLEGGKRITIDLRTVVATLDSKMEFVPESPVRRFLDQTGFLAA